VLGTVWNLVIGVPGFFFAGRAPSLWPLVALFALLFPSSSDTIVSSSSLLQDSKMVRFWAVTLRSTWNSPSRR